MNKLSYRSRLFAVMLRAVALPFAPSAYAGIALLSGGAVLLHSQPAQADAGAQGFVEGQHKKLTALMRQPASPARDAQITTALDGMVDYAVLAQRTFGQPCPAGLRECKNHWSTLSEAQRTEVTELLKKLVEKNYKKNLLKTLDYEMTYKSSSDAGSDTKVRTMAKSTVNAREAPTSIDYFVTGSGGGYRVVDIVTEGSSLARNYYNQFDRMLTNPAQGYDHVVKKLREKIASK